MTNILSNITPHRMSLFKLITEHYQEEKSIPFPVYAWYKLHDDGSVEFSMEEPPTVEGTPVWMPIKVNAPNIPMPVQVEPVYDENATSYEEYHIMKGGS